MLKRRPPSKHIIIRSYGKLGNQMFQYMLAETIRRRVPNSIVVGHDLPEWNLSERDELKRQAFAIAVRGHAIPLDALVRLARRTHHLDIMIETLSCRHHYYENDIDHFRKIFVESNNGPAPNENELVINIRLAEVLDGVHRNYFPLPIAWYETLIRQTGLSPIFVGQIGDNVYSQALLTRFPEARVHPSHSPIADFDFLRKATHIVPAISTFSWLAAWLSKARTIFMPVAGMFNPLARPDNDLLPVNDRRYRFYNSPFQQWTASSAELERFITQADPMVFRSHRDIRREFRTLLGRRGAELGSASVL